MSATSTKAKKNTKSKPSVPYRALVNSRKAWHFPLLILIIAFFGAIDPIIKYVNIILMAFSIRYYFSTLSYGFKNRFKGIKGNALLATILNIPAILIISFYCYNLIVYMLAG